MPPPQPSVFHIVHVDRLPSIIADDCLWCDAEVQRHPRLGTTIGMSSIKERRSRKQLRSRPGLFVGDCVPFYFCPRSVMLYVIYKRNHPELNYRGGQGPIVHLQADLHAAVAWADQHDRAWAFTDANAAAGYAPYYCDLARLDEIDWRAVAARDWQACRDEKQAEFLVEHSFPWSLVQHVGVHSDTIRRQVLEVLHGANHQPSVRREARWYY